MQNLQIQAHLTKFSAKREEEFLYFRVNKACQEFSCLANLTIAEISVGDDFFSAQKFGFAVIICYTVDQNSLAHQSKISLVF